MNVSTLLDHIDNGHMALPEFQRGYVWNRDQVRGLMQSLDRNYPAGGLLVWATRSDSAVSRGDGSLAPGIVKLLLDGQQRLTTLYGVIRGKPPQFFDGNAQAFMGLHFHLESETFEFYSAKKMQADPLWLDVSALMKAGNAGVGALVGELSANPAAQARIGEYLGRANALLGIREREFPVQEVTDSVARAGESSIDIVVDIFNRVNSGGTKLSKGDLALARICAEAPDARERMKTALQRWRAAGYSFDLDWLLRVVNTLVTQEAKFHFLHDIDAATFSGGLVRAEKSVDWLLNVIGGRLGLDHDRVFFGRYALPVMAHYLDRRGGTLSGAIERDRLLYWYLHAAMWGRYSGMTESKIDRDLGLLESLDGGLDRLIEELRMERGGLRVMPGHFSGWSLGARFYPVLYLLTRTGEAKDWGSGIPLKSQLLGKMSQLEVHHIFPKAQLYRRKHRRSDVNAVANFCFLTKDTNLKISATPPEVYFEEVEKAHPGALASQWIPMDRELWKIDRYLDFLEARKKLLADAANAFLAELLHAAPGDATVGEDLPAEVFTAAASGSIESDAEQAEIEAINGWVVERGLPEGQMDHELTDVDGSPVTYLDLAWPGGLQPGLSGPVALLLNEGPETLAAANRAGFRYFTSAEAFRAHVLKDVLALSEPS